MMRLMAERKGWPPVYRQALALGDDRHFSELESVDHARSQGESGDSLHARHPTGRSASSASVPSRSIISRRLTSAASFRWPAPPPGRNCHAPSSSLWVTSKTGCRPKAIDLVVKTATLGGSSKGQVMSSRSTHSAAALGKEAEASRPSRGSFAFRISIQQRASGNIVRRAHVPDEVVRRAAAGGCHVVDGYESGPQVSPHPPLPTPS